jgi:two-component system NtrC family sensor kinase
VIAQLDPGLPKAMVDPEQMRQALINILENAAEAMAGGGQLTVSTELAPEGRSLSIRVTDTGRGIPEENLERVFHPFFTTKQIGRGTGLGLAIVYGIVKTHHGSISVDSKVGAGTTFTISLPVPDSREAREQR